MVVGHNCFRAFEGRHDRKGLTAASPIYQPEFLSKVTDNISIRSFNACVMPLRHMFFVWFFAFSRTPFAKLLGCFVKCQEYNAVIFKSFKAFKKNRK